MSNCQEGGHTDAIEKKLIKENIEPMVTLYYPPHGKFLTFNKGHKRQYDPKNKRVFVMEYIIYQWEPNDRLLPPWKKETRPLLGPYTYPMFAPGEDKGKDTGWSIHSFKEISKLHLAANTSATGGHHQPRLGDCTQNQH